MLKTLSDVERNPCRFTFPNKLQNYINLTNVKTATHLTMNRHPWHNLITGKLHNEFTLLRVTSGKAFLMLL